ncbi:MAG: DUF2232 domain-containing protein [Christensenella sp.]|nr:DUF2232 domain-containing protein [Christensenella sp.]
MENYQQQQPRKMRLGWPVLLLSVLIGLIAVVFPVALVLAPGLWAYAGARTKPYWIALPAAAFAIAALQLYTPVAAVGLSLASALAAGVIFALLTRRVSNTYTALILGGVFLGGLYAAVCLPGILAGRGAFADVQRAMDTILSLYRSAMAQTPELSAEVKTLFAQALDTFQAEVPNLIVSALCIFAGLFGLGNLLFFRLFCRKHKEIEISPMRAFRDWTLPRSMTFGLFVLLIGSLALEWAGWAFAEGFSNTVNALVGMPLLLQGLCVVDFLLSRSPKNATLGRALTYTGIGILFSFAQTPLILIGCFEQIFRFRDRMRGVPPRAAI